MKKLVAAFLLTTTLASPAHALSGWYEELTFVSETQMPDMALCHLVKKSHAAYMPYWTSSLGYAFAENNCDTETYLALTREQVIEMQTNGLIPNTIPPVASISTQQRLVNYAVLGIVGIFILFGIVAKFSGRSAPRQVSGRQVSRGNRSQLLPALVDVMCAMSSIDGDVDQREIEVIAEIFHRMTGRKVSQKDIIAQIQAIQGPVNFVNLAQVFNQTEREILLEAAIRVATADGRIEEQEYEFIGDMTEAFDFGAEQIRNIMVHLNQAVGGGSNPHGSPQPA